MKLVKTHSFINPDGAASILLPVELHALLQLDAWAFRLFAALVKLADFKTGKGQCHYPSLLAWMTAPKNESGGQQPVTHSRAQVKRMLRAMEGVGLLTLNANASEAEKVIFFEVRARDWKSALENRRVRRGVRPETPQNADEQRVSGVSKGQSRPTLRPGVQSPSETFPSIKEGSVDNLSTALGATQELAPPGGQEVGPDGPRPPPEARTGTGEGVRGGQQEGPPGGRIDAPAGHAPGAVLVDDPSTWQRDAEGRLILPTEHGGRHARPTARQAPQGGLRRGSLS